jgi:large subunit ribosomal protein L30
MSSKEKKKTVRVQQVKSWIGYNRRQREVLRGMGLRRIRHVVELPDNDATWGMIKKVQHLVRVLPAEESTVKEKKQ